MRTPARASAPSLDEARFHRWLARRLRPGLGALPIGDDTAALSFPPGRSILLTSDAFVEGFHFLPRSSPRRVGAAVASVNLSDIAAKGGTPVAFLLDLLIPPGTPEAWARSVVLGAELRLAQFGAHIVGGDTKPSTRRGVVGALVGTARPDRLAPRSGARPGDLVVTTGTVGRGGFAMLRSRRRDSRPADPDLFLDITPRVHEGAKLARWAHAMLDTSDGLADSARLLAEASGVGVVVDSERIPFDANLARAVPSGAALLSHAFVGGDYELLAALPKQFVDPARTALARLGCPLTTIGRVGGPRGAWLATSGRKRPMPEGGWRPFGRGRGGAPR